MFVRPSQVHIIDAHPQDEHEEDEQLHDNADVSQDISQDEIQNETIPEDDEVFAVPQPPKASRVNQHTYHLFRGPLIEAKLHFRICDNDLLI